MALPEFTMRQLLEAGVHFGHQAHRWNPKMRDYIFGVRNNIHIIDLAQTVPMLHRALEAISDTVAKGGRILFVGTKRQAQDPVAEAAKRCAQYYVNSRWLGGTLTNWKTISQSIARLRKLDEMLASNEAQGYTKKERLTLTRERYRCSISTPTGIATPSATTPIASTTPCPGKRETRPGSMTSAIAHAITIPIPPQASAVTSTPSDVATEIPEIALWYATRCPSAPPSLQSPRFRTRASASKRPPT